MTTPSYAIALFEITEDGGPPDASAQAGQPGCIHAHRGTLGEVVGYDDDYPMVRFPKSQVPLTVARWEAVLVTPLLAGLHEPIEA